MLKMNLIIAVLLTLVPGIELRAGIPVAVGYALENNFPVILVFLLIILINVLLIFFVFYFLDNLHIQLLRLEIYKKFFNKYLKNLQKKIDKFENRRRLGKTEFIGLALFVSIPVPGTGVWSGCLISWLLGFDRKKSILSIGLGVLIAGTLVLLGTLGFFELFNIFN